MLRSDVTRMRFPVVPEWCSIMIATDWTMSGIITVHWDGRLPAAGGKISMHMRRRTKYFLHVQGLQSTAKRS